MAGFNTIVSALAAVLLFVQQKADDCLSRLNLNSLSLYFRETLTLSPPPPVTQYITRTLHQVHTVAPVTVTSILAPATTLEVITTAPTAIQDSSEQVHLHTFVDKNPWDWILLGSLVITISVIASAFTLAIKSQRRKQLHMYACGKIQEQPEDLVVSFRNLLSRMMTAVHTLVSSLGHLLIACATYAQEHMIHLTTSMIATNKDLWTLLMSTFQCLYARIAPSFYRSVSRVISFLISSFRGLHIACTSVWQISSEYVLEPFGKHVWPTVSTFFVCLLRDYLWWFLRNCVGPAIAEAFILPYKSAFQSSFEEPRQTQNQSQTQDGMTATPGNNITQTINLTVTPTQPNNFRVPYTPESGLRSHNSKYLSPADLRVYLTTLEENKTLRLDIGSLKKKLLHEQAQREDAECRAENEQTLGAKLHLDLLETQRKLQTLESNSNKRFAPRMKPEPVTPHFKLPGEDTKKTVTVYNYSKSTRNQKSRFDRHARSMISSKPCLNVVQKLAAERTSRLARLLEGKKQQKVDSVTSHENTQEQNTVEPTHDTTIQRQTSYHIIPETKPVEIIHENTIEQQGTHTNTQEEKPVETSYETTTQQQDSLDTQEGKTVELTHDATIPQQDSHINTQETQTVEVPHENTIEQQHSHINSQERSTVELNYEHTIQQQNSDLLAYQNTMHEQQSQLNELYASTLEKDGHIKQLNQKIRILTASSQEKDGHIGQLNQRINDLAGLAASSQEKDGLIEQLNQRINDLASLATSSQEKDGLIEQLNQRINYLIASSQEKDGHIGQLNQRINDLAGLAASTQEKHGHIEQLNQKMNEKDAKIGQLESELVVLKTQVALLDVFQQQAAKYQQEAGGLREELRQARLELHGANETIAGLEWDLDELQGQLTVNQGPVAPPPPPPQQPTSEYPPLDDEVVNLADQIAAMLDEEFDRAAAGRVGASAPTSTLPGLGLLGEGETGPLPAVPERRKLKPRLRRPAGLEVASPASPSPVVAGGGPTDNPSPVFVPNLAYVPAIAAPRSGPAAVDVNPAVKAMFDPAQLSKLAGMGAGQLHELAMTDPARAANRGGDGLSEDEEEDEEDEDEEDDEEDGEEEEEEEYEEAEVEDPVEWEGWFDGSNLLGE